MGRIEVWTFPLGKERLEGQLALGGLLPLQMWTQSFLYSEAFNRTTPRAGAQHSPTSRQREGSQRPETTLPQLTPSVCTH